MLARDAEILGNVSCSAKFVNGEEMDMKKIISTLLALVLVLSLTACGSGKSANLRFVTGGESGTYYGFGSVIAQHATNNAGVNRPCR